MIGRLLRRQTLASFDYQWRELPEGQALVSDPWFLANVERILAEELLALRREWFPGRRVLDAGAGAGRWTVGLLRLGCEVTAVDASAHALRQLEENVASACDPAERARLSTTRVDLLDLPAELVASRYDLVYSFGVLHHTGDTRRALAQLAPLVAPDGVLFLYLYGRESLSASARALLTVERLALAPLPHALKRRVIAAVFRRSDTHAVFDVLSPTINTRHTFAEVADWMHELGFADVRPTIEHTEVFVRATRDERAIAPFALPPARPPYWFERYA